MIVGIIAWSFTLTPKLANKNVAVTNNRVCTDEAKICPDGSAVGRTEPNCEFATCPVITYKQFVDAKTGISFEYPSTWIQQTTVNDQPLATTTIVSLLDPRQPKGIEAPLSTVTLERYEDVNSEAILGGSWEGMRTYTSLADMLSDHRGFKQSTGMTILGGGPAFDVTVGGIGQNYSIMVQRPDGIFELDFITANDKSSLTEVEQHIISSFRFKQLPS